MKVTGKLGNQQITLNHHLAIIPFKASCKSLQLPTTGVGINVYQKNLGFGWFSVMFSTELYQRWWISRWWFQMFFIFTPIWGRFPFWLIFFKGVETTTQIWLKKSLSRRFIHWSLWSGTLKTPDSDGTSQSCTAVLAATRFISILQGIYEDVQEKSEVRVYKHTSQDLFMYTLDGKWFIGTSPGSSSVYAWSDQGRVTRCSSCVELGLAFRPSGVEGRSWHPDATSSEFACLAGRATSLGSVRVPFL